MKITPKRINGHKMLKTTFQTVSEIFLLEVHRIREQLFHKTIEKGQMEKKEEEVSRDSYLIFQK
jgi:hypothetical protein